MGHSSFRGSVPLLTLYVYCFPNQSRDVFRELQDRSISLRGLKISSCCEGGQLKTMFLS